MRLDPAALLLTACSSGSQVTTILVASLLCAFACQSGPGTLCDGAGGQCMENACMLPTTLTAPDSVQDCQPADGTPDDSVCCIVDAGPGSPGATPACEGRVTVAGDVVSWDFDGGGLLISESETTSAMGGTSLLPGPPACSDILGALQGHVPCVTALADGATTFSGCH